MKRGTWRVALLAAALTLLGAAPGPTSPRDARPGIWEISLSATGSHPRRVCLADPMLLSQWEHRGLPCRRDLIAEHDASATISYACGRAGFGQSVVTLVTPRSLKIDTQGIADGLPFAYALYARRVGECRGR